MQQETEEEINQKINKNQKKVKIIKLITLVLVVIILIVLTLKLFPMFMKLTTSEGRLEFKTQIQGMGPLGALSIIGLMMAQMILAVLPGEPVEILAGMCFGTIGGMFILFLGAFLSTALAFFAVRKFGKSFIYSFFGKDKFDKFLNSKLFSNKKRMWFVLFLMFFLPGAPKDLFAILGGLLPVSPVKFLLLSTFGRFPSIITSTYAGSNLTEGNFMVSIITLGVTVLVSGIGLLVSYFIHKKSIQQETPS